MKDIRIKRVYDSPAQNDGFRVLVDRVWPRGMTKEKVKADLWLKELAPGTELRKWFKHDPSRWDEFKRLYFSELDEQQKPLRQLLDRTGKQRLTLLYSARDTRHNQAAALKEYLLKGDRKKRV